MVGLSARENRSYASELAERGFVTLAPSYPLLANYQIEPADCGFESGTMMAIWDNVRGLDYLDSLQFVANRTPVRHRVTNGSALPVSGTAIMCRPPAPSIPSLLMDTHC